MVTKKVKPKTIGEIAQTYKYHREAFTTDGEPKNGGYYKTLNEAMEMAQYFYDKYGFNGKISRKNYNDKGKFIGMTVIKTIGLVK